MPFRGWLAALGAMALASPAMGQIQSSGLGDLNPWGSSLLERGESGVDGDLWTGSDAGYLLTLMEGLDTSTMSAAERGALSRALRSPGAAPQGDLVDELQAERLRLLMALDERRAVSTLARQVSDLPEGVDPDAIVADERLARGELKVVCAQMDPGADGKFWAELRAVCALAGGNMASAELAIEIAGQQDGADPWFTETAITVIGELEDRPDARLGSGLEVALSDLAGLELSEESLVGARPDLAVMVASDRELPIRLRVQAADIVAAGGALPPREYRAIYDELLASEDFEPDSALEVALVALALEPEAPPEPIVPEAGMGPRDLRSMNEDWLVPVQPDDVDENALDAEEPDQVSVAEAQSMALAEALRVAMENPDTFLAVARMVEPDLGGLPADEDTSANAHLFALTALAIDNPGLALRWLGGPMPEEAGEADLFENALLSGYALARRGEGVRDELDDIVAVLLETGVEPGQQQAALKLFTVWSGLDIPVPVEARSALAQAEFDGRAVSSGMLAAIDAAVRNGAPGEALLLVLTQTDGEPEALSGAGLSTALQVLRGMGAEDDAWALALASADFW